MNNDKRGESNTYKVLKAFEALIMQIAKDINEVEKTATRAF